MIKKYCRFL